MNSVNSDSDLAPVLLAGEEEDVYKIIGLMKFPDQVYTRIPLNVFMLGAIVIVLTWQSLFNPVWIIYMLPIWIIFYMGFCRYCCTISINRDEFYVHYLSPWNKDILIKPEDIVKLEYEKGFYDFFSDNRIVNYGLFPMYCFDRLTIHLKDSKVIEVNINTRLFDFGKVLKWARGMEVLNE